MSTKYTLLIYDFVDNIKIYLDNFHKPFGLTLLLSEICSIFNYNKNYVHEQLFVNI